MPNPRTKPLTEREREIIKIMLVSDLPMRAGAAHIVFVGEEITGRSTLAHLRDMGIIELEREGDQAQRSQLWILTKKGKKEARK